MKISDIISREEYLYSEIDDSLEFDGVFTDLNDCSESDLLIIPNAEKLPDFSKAKAMPMAVICGVNAILPENIPAIRVNSPRLAMANIYFRYNKISCENMKFVGVTGTNGKTTTATLIKEILSQLGHKVGFIGTGKIEINKKNVTEENYSMTTPDPKLLYKTIKRMEEEGCDVVVMEVSSHSLALDKLAPLQFDYGIFTNLSPEHLDFHGSMENYFESKKKLFSSCKCGIFNIDDKYAERSYSLFGGRKLSVGIIKEADVWARNVENLGFDGINYTYHQEAVSFKTNLKLSGIYNTYNSMLAMATCIDMGCKPCEVKKIINQISSIPGRYEIINDKISVIIDYAHTSEAFSCILRDLSAQKGAGRLAVVFGSGGDRDKGKRPVMAKIAERYADRIILTADNSRSESTKDIISDIIRGFDKGNYEVKERREEAIFSAILSADDGDTVAIIGKGPEKYNIDKDGYHRFDERAIIMSALKKRGGEE